MADLLSHLKGVRPGSGGWTARCPAHDDHYNSLSVHQRDGRLLLKCHAGCGWREIIDALGLDATVLFVDQAGGGGRRTPSNNRATAQPRVKSTKTSDFPAMHRKEASADSARSGLTLEQYAAAKALPLDFLKTCGLSELTLDKKLALRIPYRGAGGEELAVRFRIALEGDRFRWKSGSKPCLYGLDRLEEAQKADHVVLVEGESDCQTFWFHGIPAVGFPGASSWREERDAKHLDNIETIYIIIEPDRGGDAVRKWLARSAIRTRAKLISLPSKDPSALHVEDS
jgi:5S rRNA maturation endonuclease (ribonuclease M5)